MAEFVIPADVDTPFAQMLRVASGASEGEDLHVITPTFERPSNMPPPMIPPSQRTDWANLHRLKREDLRAWGLLPWGSFTTEPPPKESSRCGHRDAVYYNLDEDDDPRQKTHELWLMPGTWYPYIPNGFPVVDIFGVLEEFEAGKSDDDIRYGCLAFGIVIPFQLT